MKRYYLCDLVGDGSEDNPYRPAVADLGYRFSATWSTGADGRPSGTWALAIVAAANHTPLRNRPGIDPMPDVSLDIRLSAVQAATRSQMEAAMARRGIPALAGNADGYRELIQHIGRKASPAFDVDAFDVAE